MSIIMEISQALAAFAALSNETRLLTFKALVEYGPKGAPAGVIAAGLGVVHNTLSFHLSALEAAGLVHSQKCGRNVIYNANIENMNALISYLTDNCCVRDNVDCIELKAFC